jgi:hypothetical protein
LSKLNIPAPDFLGVGGGFLVRPPPGGGWHAKRDWGRVRSPPSRRGNGLLRKTKNALSYQDEKTRYHLISFLGAGRKTLLLSDNGLTRRALNARPRPYAAHTHGLTGDLSPSPQGLAPTVLSLRGIGGLLPINAEAYRQTPKGHRIRGEIGADTQGAQAVCVSGYLKG